MPPPTIFEVIISHGFEKGKRKGGLKTAYIKKTNNPKMGRPTDSPKSIVIRARISEEENRMLNDCIEKSGKTKTDVIVEGIRLVYEGLEEK